MAPSWDLLVVVTYIQYIHSTEFLFAERKHQAAPQMKTFTKGILSIHYAMLLGLVNGKIILHCSLHFLMMVRANNTWANGHNLGQLYRLMEKLAAEREAWVSAGNKFRLVVLSYPINNLNTNCVAQCIGALISAIKLFLKSIFRYCVFLRKKSRKTQVWNSVWSFFLTDILLYTFTYYLHCMQYYVSCVAVMYCIVF